MKNETLQDYLEQNNLMLVPKTRLSDEEIINIYTRLGGEFDMGEGGWKRQLIKFARALENFKNE